MQKTVFQTDSDGLFLYESVANELPLTPDSFNVPFGAYEDAPPEAAAGKRQRRTDDAWLMVDDYRAMPLWVVDTGEPYSIGSEEQGAAGNVSYPGWGPLPAWLTSQQPARATEDVTAVA